MEKYVKIVLFVVKTIKVHEKTYIDEKKIKYYLPTATNAILNYEGESDNTTTGVK